ncbi:Uncharacterised protein [Bordetella pertussis]|nr:Uncharacterised protein [Bordetella pertussis]CFW46063.1 Uncharacterised protein [Bordetella pertussis]
MPPARKGPGKLRIIAPSGAARTRGGRAIAQPQLALIWAALTTLPQRSSSSWV